VLLGRLKNHRLIAVLAVIAVVLAGVQKATDSVSAISRFVWGMWPRTQDLSDVSVVVHSIDKEVFPVSFEIRNGPTSLSDVRVLCGIDHQGGYRDFSQASSARDSGDRMLRVVSLAPNSTVLYEHCEPQPPLDAPDTLVGATAHVEVIASIPNHAGRYGVAHTVMLKKIPLDRFPAWVYQGRRMAWSESGLFWWEQFEKK
jgi:hypothetical protein